MKLVYSTGKEALERNFLVKREELPFIAFEEDKLLGRHRVRLNISWEKDIDGRNKINFSGGFPARLYITESRLIIISEFYSQDKVYKVIKRVPIGWMRYNTVYVELAIDKIQKYSFGRFRSYIILEPHGSVGRTKIDLYNLSKEEKRLIKEDLDTAKVFRKPATESGIVILDRPIAETVTQRFTMLQHEAFISKYFKKPEVEKVQIKRVRKKGKSSVSTEVESEQSGVKKEEQVQPSESVIEIPPQERIKMALQLQLTKCKFCGQELLKSAKKCTKCGAINF
ncbi:MAG: hypothetical protein QW279_07425 [Candidatus Jordarchaeaceae archaeon]